MLQARSAPLAERFKARLGYGREVTGTIPGGGINPPIEFIGIKSPRIISPVSKKLHRLSFHTSNASLEVPYRV